MPKHTSNGGDELKELIRVRIENLRPKLLDLSRRNPLISTRFSPRSNSHIRVVDELPDVLSFHLSGQQKMRFVPLPPLEEDPKDEQNRNFQSTLANARLTDETYLFAVDEIDPYSEKALEQNRQLERGLRDRVRELLGISPRQTSSDVSLPQHAKNNGISPSYELPEPTEEHEDGRPDVFGVSGDKLIMIILRSIFALLLLIWPLPTSAMVDYVEITSYRGDLDENIVIQMDLQFKDAPQIIGSYFYKRWLKDIPLKGHFLSERDIELQEFDSHGKLAGTFHLRFPERDPRGQYGNSVLQREVIIGHWQSADGIRKLPVYLNMEMIIIFLQGSSRYAVSGSDDDALVELNVQGFYQAALKGDRKAVSQYVHYPLSFNLDGTKHQVWNKTAFLRYYSRIFTPQFVAKIADGIPHNMFTNSQGTMIANGAVWFNGQGKAVVLNNFGSP